MKVEFDHVDYAQTVAYRLDWALASDPSTVVFTQTFAKNQFGPLPGAPTPRYLKDGGFLKPNPFTGPYVLAVTATNTVGESAPVASSPFSVSAPGPVSNVAVVEAHL